MANHVTKHERDALRRAALDITKLDADGQIINRAATVADLMVWQPGVSKPRAERAVAYAARRKRSPDYEPPTAGRPATLDDGQAVTVYLPAAMAERAAELGDGNVSAGVRIALQRALV